MSVKIMFVIPASCRSEKECDPNMIEAYNIARNHDIGSQWIRADDPNIAKIETNKTDFIVFEDMAGDFYKKVQNTKSVRILSPLVLLHCLKSAKPIPQSESPLVSLALENCIVVCSCLPKESKRDLKSKVQAMAGLFCMQLVSDTTYLISEGVKSEKYNRAVEENMKIMTVHFIDALWEASKTRVVHASNEEFQKFKCPAFLNLNICSTGFSKHETHIQTLVEAHGGIFSSAMDVSKTDILVCKSSASTSSAKYKSAMKNKIDCVTGDWIVDSAERGCALPNLKDYAVKAATSTPTKRDNFYAPNVSQVSMIMKPGSQLSEMTTQVVEQTINMSYVSTASAKTSSEVEAQDDVINNIDIKRVKSCGLFLEGCVIFVAGFKPEQKEKLCKILNFSGAIPCFSLNDQITHAILGSTTCAEFKQLTSKNFPCAIVNVTWLVDSMTAQMPVNVDDYLMTAGHNSSAHSPGLGTNSPLSKKGLSFLRSDVTILKKDDQAPAAPEPATDQNDEDIQRYFTGMQSRDSVDDALAAFSLNPAANQEKPDEGNTSKPEETSKRNASSPSISITMEESVVPIFANLKFVIVNCTQEEEAYVANYIKEMHGTVVTNVKGIPDYAVVPVGNQSLQVTATNVVTYLWVMDCVEQNQLLLDMQYYHLPYPFVSEVLAGLVITLSGFTKWEKEFLSQVVSKLGGVQQDCMSRYTVAEKNTLATTHLILMEPTGKKYQGALKWGLPVVSKEWLLRCGKEERRVPEVEFLLGEGKENQSMISSASKQGLKTKLADQFASPAPKSKQPKMSLAENVVQTPPRKNTNTYSPVTPASETFRRLGLSSPSAASPVASGSQHEDVHTPNRRPLTAYSQITPVNEIMARVRLMCGDVQTPGENTPKTPACERLDDSMATPETPYGAIFQNPPPPEMRKRWKRWVDKMPEPYKSPGTPLSEIKRQFWKKYYETHPRPIVGNDDKAHRDLAAEFSTQEALSDMEIPMAAENSCNDTENAMNNLVIGKLNELDSLMMTGSDVTRRQSTKKIDSDVGVAPVKDSQPMTVGWDEHMVIPSEQPPKPKIFMISGVDVVERSALAEKLEQLGGTISALSNFDPSSTHLLCEKLNRNEKLLASMASGLWILHISYAIDSAAAGKLLNEEDYEFGSPKATHKFKLDSDSMQKAAAARYWRQEISRRGYGAFHDIRAIVLANKKEPMIRVLQAGGAMIVNASPPFEENVSATHCLIEVKNTDLTPFIPLAQQGILCINTLYVNDFLQRTGEDINDFIVPGFGKYY